MVLLILTILHDLNMLQFHNSEGIRYLLSCRVFSINSSNSRASLIILGLCPKP